MPIHHHYACTSSSVVVVMPANLLRGNVAKKGWRSREIDLMIFPLSPSFPAREIPNSLPPPLFQSIDINLLSPPFIRQQKTPPKPRQKQPKGNGGERKSERGRVRAEGVFFSKKGAHLPRSKVSRRWKGLRKKKGGKNFLLYLPRRTVPLYDTL